MSAFDFLGSKLQNKDGEIATSEALAGKKMVGIYFSAHWCPPCRGFTPKLADAYTTSLKDKGMEIIFVSSDRDQGSFDSYFGEQPWLALPYSEREKKNELSKKFKVDGIPTFVILDGETGELMVRDGRTAVMSDPKGENMGKYPWIKPTFAGAMGEIENFVKVEEGRFGGKVVSVSKDVIKGKYLGLYFSAHWCPPCRGYTPKLAKNYAKYLENGLKDKFEIIFVSSDRSDEDFASYFKEQAENGGTWLSLPYGDVSKNTKAMLDALYEVEGIPTLVVLDQDGKLVNADGRNALGADSDGSKFPWVPPAVADLEDGPGGLNKYPCVILLADTCEKDTAEEFTKTLTDIAEGMRKDTELGFYMSTKNEDGNSISDRIRSLTKVEESKTGSLIITDIPDEGGYYAFDGEINTDSIKKFIADFKSGSLTRKQLGGSD